MPFCLRLSFKDKELSVKATVEATVNRRTAPFEPGNNICGYLTKGALEGYILNPISQHSLENAAEYLKAQMADYQNDAKHWPREHTEACAIVLVDRERSSVSFCSDRLGCITLLFRQNSESLILTSGSEPINVSPPSGQLLSSQSVYDYFYYHIIPSPKTIWENTRRTLPAHSYQIGSSGKVLSHCYWKPEFPQFKPEGYSKHPILQTLRKVIAENKVCDKTAIFLSGGLDSTTIAGLAGEVYGAKNVQAYCMGFDAPGYDEMQYARAGAEHFGIALKEYYLKPTDIIDAVEKVVATAPQPFGNSSIVPTYFCTRLAVADGFDNIITKNNNNKLFGDNTRYSQQTLFDVYKRMPTGLQGLLEAVVDNNLLGLFKRPPLSKVESFISQTRMTLAERLQRHNFLNYMDTSEIFTSEFLCTINQSSSINIMEDYLALLPNAETVERMLFSDWKFTLSDNDLLKVGYCGEANNINLQFPFLDKKVLELSLHMSVSEKATLLSLRKAYRKAMKGFLPRTTLKKSKHGFGLPFGYWLLQSKELQEYVYDLVYSNEVIRILRRDFIDRLRSRYLPEHPGYYGEMIWLIFAFAAWSRENRALFNF